MPSTNFDTILQTLFGGLTAIAGGVAGSIITYYFNIKTKEREERDKLRKELTSKFLIQLQDSIQSFYKRLGNMKDGGGYKYMKYMKGDPEYYRTTTLYSLGGILGYHHRILLPEGVYSQLEYVYPEFGYYLKDRIEKFGVILDDMTIKDNTEVTNLISLLEGIEINLERPTIEDVKDRIEEFGKKLDISLDDMKVKDVKDRIEEFGKKLDNINRESLKYVKFFRYDRIALGEISTETRNGITRLIPYSEFEYNYKNDEKVRPALEPAIKFIDNLPFVPEEELGMLMKYLNRILEDLEQKSEIKTQDSKSLNI